MKTHRGEGQLETTDGALGVKYVINAGVERHTYTATGTVAGEYGGLWHAMQRAAPVILVMAGGERFPLVITRLAGAGPAEVRMADIPKTEDGKDATHLFR